MAERCRKVESITNRRCVREAGHFDDHEFFGSMEEVEPTGLADEVERIVFAFSDTGRKEAVRLLAARIRALESELAELRKREEWIPVAERLPEHDSWCWIVWCGHVQEQPWQFLESYHGPNWRHDDESLTVDRGVTHWIPLAVPPRPEPEHRDEGKSG